MSQRFLIKTLVTAGLLSIGWTSVSMAQDSLLPDRPVPAETEAVQDASPLPALVVGVAAPSESTFEGSLLTPENVPETPDDDWQMFRDGRLAQLYASFVRRQQSDPGWQPSPGLLEEMIAADLRLRISNAVSVRQYDLADALLRANPHLVTCDHAWLGWAAIISFAGLGDTQDATALADRMVSKCNLSKTDIRDGLLRVAIQAPPDTSEAVVARLGKRLSLDLRRALARRIALTRIGAWSELQTIEYERREREAGQSVNVEHMFPEIAPEQPVLDAVRLIESNLGWVGTQERFTLAWFFYNNGQPQDAVRYFVMADASMTMDMRRSFAHGETLARIQARDFVAAEAVWPAFHDKGGPVPRTEVSYPLAVTNLISHTRRRRDDPLYAGIWSLPPDARKRIEQLAADLNSAELFQQLGWLEQRKHNCTGGIVWFERALEIDPNHEEAAWGLANCYHSTDKMAQLEALRLAWADRSFRITGLSPDGVSKLFLLPEPRPNSFDGMVYRPPITGKALAALILKAPPPPDADDAEPVPQRVSRRRSSGSPATSCRPGASPAGMSAGQALAHGWCMLELKRPFDAIAGFDRAAKSSSQTVREEAAYGRSIALLRKGLITEADLPPRPRSASAQGGGPKLSKEKLTEQAIAAHNSGDYRQAIKLFDQRARLGGMALDLRVLQGWSYYSNGQVQTAKKIWRAAAQAGSAKAIEALNIANR